MPAELPHSPFRVLHPTRRSPPYLDATSACLPAELTASTEVSVRLRDGDIVGVRRALAKLEARAPREAAAAEDLRALAALVEARTAGSVGRESARLALRRVAERDERPAVRACALLERARLSLLLERPFDARIDRSRARRVGDPGTWPVERDRIARWLEAEELHRAGDDAAAKGIWQDLAGASDARLAVAAQLRLVEALFPIGGEAASDPVAAWKTFPGLLAGAALARLDVEPWALVAGELAIRAGDLAAAHHWFARAELEWRGGLASVRKADVLTALGRTGDARNTLDRVVRGAKDPDVRDLAQLRIAQLELDAGKVPLALERAAVPARSLHPFVRGEALLLIARAELAGGRPRDALESYVRVARGSGQANQDASFREGFADTLRELTAPGESCGAVLQHLGTRAAVLERSVRDAGPLLRVGDCFLQLRMPGAALDTYRIAARRFGDDGAAALPLRIATAALAVGDLDAVRKAVEAALPSASDAPDDIGALRWRWLDFALAEREGRARDGLAQLDRLARAEALPPDLRSEVERALLGRLDRESERDGARDALMASIALAPELASDLRGTTWLRLADLALAAGDTEDARGAYERAAALLAPSPLRDRALHHGALLVATKQERRDALASAASSDPNSAWSRVAGLELRLQRLAEQVDGTQARTP